MGIAQPSDAELLARLRSGGDAAAAAFVQLRERYTRPVGRTVDRRTDGLVASLDGRSHDGISPDRLGIHQAQPGPAPLDEVPEGVRGELPDTRDPAARAVVLVAYASLPERARAVLWLTEVEGCPASVVATVLGMTPPAAAALASRSREQLSQAYLRERLRASPRPRCGRPHGSRLAGYARHGDRDGFPTAASTHVEACSSCRELVAAVREAPRVLVRSLVPSSAPPAGTRAAVSFTAASRRRPGRAIAGIGGKGRRVAAVARGDPALTGTVAVAAALVLAVLAAAFLPGRSPADVASPGPAPAEERVIVPAPPAPPAAAAAADRMFPPSTTVPSPAAVGPVDPGAPPDRPPFVPAGPSGVDRRPAPRPSDPPAAAAPTTTVPPPPAPVTPVAPNPGTPTVPSGGDPAIGVASVAAVPAVSSVVWQPTSSQVEVTLVNAGAQATGFLVMTLQAAGGAIVDAQPTGCALALGMVTTGMCTLRPLGPGATAVVQVPMTVTRPGQSAQVQVCAVALLRLECTTPLLTPTVVELA